MLMLKVQYVRVLLDRRVATVICGHIKKQTKFYHIKKDNAKRIKCQKLDDFGNVLEEFDSFKDAALSLGKKPHSGNQISLCARGKYNKMYGFKWRIKK